MRTPQKKTLGGQTVRKIQKIQMVESRKHKAEELDTVSRLSSGKIWWLFVDQEEYPPLRN